MSGRVAARLGRFSGLAPLGIASRHLEGQRIGGVGRDAWLSEVYSMEDFETLAFILGGDKCRFHMLVRKDKNINILRVTDSE